MIEISGDICGLERDLLWVRGTLIYGIAVLPRAADLATPKAVRFRPFEGSLRKAGDRLRITAQLISVETGCPLWSERYDRELNDLFAIQDEISLAPYLIVLNHDPKFDALRSDPRFDDLVRRIGLPVPPRATRASGRIGCRLDSYPEKS